MTREERCEKVREAVENIQFEGACLEVRPYGSGHINDTFLVVTQKPGDAIQNWILQRINHEIFTNPKELMDNISSVTAYLKKEIERNGGDPLRETLTIIPALDGGAYYRDSNGSYWRGYAFIQDAITYDMATPELFYESAVAFGHFQNMLAAYPADSLHETIANFHNTWLRYQALEEAIAADVCGRVREVGEEIAFWRERKEDTKLLLDRYESGVLPLRVTHNDTKLNNVMIDTKTGKGICVIDLDTVMPGFSVNDFGDSIRFGASTAAEDEPDLEKVSMDLERFAMYTKGFLEGCAGRLTEEEHRLLPAGARMMTMECGIRFLTDYLQGDTYFRVHRDRQNLDRCRTQMKLVADMEKKWTAMQDIVERY